jgi:hypothetical protein
MRKALQKMKNGKAAGPSKAVSEILKAAGTEWLNQLFNAITRESKSNRGLETKYTLASLQG